MKLPTRCHFCQADLTVKPFEKFRNEGNGQEIGLCLKGCRWFPESYPESAYKWTSAGVYYPKGVARREKEKHESVRG
jgi:hypothetical protein